jgi:hypothetical protein
MQLYLEAVKLNPEYGDAFSNLGLLASSTDNIRLPDGRIMTKQDLYLEAIRLDPTDANSLNNLANTLTGTQTITLPDGRTLTKKELYLESIKHNPSFETPYSNLGINMIGTSQCVMEKVRSYWGFLLRSCSCRRSSYNSAIEIPNRISL